MKRRTLLKSSAATAAGAMKIDGKLHWNPYGTNYVL